MVTKTPDIPEREITMLDKSYFKTVTICLLAILFFTFQGIGAELSDLAYRLTKLAENLANDGYQGINSRERRNRNEVEVMFLTEQFRASAGLFQRMVQDNRPVSELRRASELLKSQSDNFSSYSLGRQRTYDLNRILDDIVREVNQLALRDTTGDQLARSRRDIDNRRDQRLPSKQVSGPGKVTWKGLVDDEVHIQFVGDQVYVQVVSGGEVQNVQCAFTNSLPNQNTTVALRKIRGRGTIGIFEQPSRENNYQAVVRIYDPKAGNSEYEFELSWP
jgi:hypothetical protein